jgi:hypothetical protein
VDVERGRSEGNALAKELEVHVDGEGTERLLGDET